MYIRYYVVAYESHDATKEGTKTPNQVQEENVDPKTVQEVLRLHAPPKLTDRQKRINDRRNRNMRDAMILSLIRHYAEATGNDPNNFGLTQLQVDDSLYFFGVIFLQERHRYARLINIDSFPSSYVKDTILAFIETYAPDAMGVYSGAKGLEFLYVDLKGMYRRR